MVLAAGLAPVHGGGAGGRPALHRPDVTGVDRAEREKSSGSAARSSDGSSSCSFFQTPASFQSRSRLQQVIPEPEPSSYGRNSQRIPVQSTNRIPHGTLRGSSRLRSG